MRYCFAIYLIAGCLISPDVARAQDDAPKLLIAFASYRDRPRYPGIFLYEHDGVRDGKIIASIPVTGKRSDSHPILTQNGRFCVFASEQENKTSKIFRWDFENKKLDVLSKLNTSPNAQLHPTQSGDGSLIAFAAWNRPGTSQRWTIVTADAKSKKVLDQPKSIFKQTEDQRMPALSGSGRYLAFATSAKTGLGGTDVFLFDRMKETVDKLPAMNSAYSDLTPSLSGDGRLIAFASNRPGGEGGRDIYLFDRNAKKLIELPGLNSVANEQTPSLNADGRYIVFVSERISGQGERDVFLYDRKTQGLLPTPKLNSKREDIDPWIVVQ